MGARRRAREHALKVLYQVDVGGASAADALRGHWDMEPEDDGQVRAFAERLVGLVIADLATVDGLISEASRNWTIDRLGAVDRNLLRLAVGELRSGSDTPPAVVIDEAVEIAKSYGESESSAFVNGILEAVRRKLAADRATPGDAPG